MTNDQKDAICQLWVEIFGTQAGVGYNCPQGAYDFAEVVSAHERERCAKIADEARSIEGRGIARQIRSME